MEKAKTLEGQEFEFNQYMCSRCQRMFFILSEDIVEIDEKGKFKDFRSPCCRPYESRYPPDGTMKDPTGTYIRHIKLKIVDIPDEIALVARRRRAAEKGKMAYPDPKEKEE